MELDLPSWSSIPFDGLASPSLQQLFRPQGLWESSDDDAGLDESINNTGTPPGTPYYSSGNAHLQGASWPQQALKASECGIEQSAGLVETTSWAPIGNHSGSCVQSSESGLSEGVPAPADVPAAEPAAAAGPRVVLRSRARRNQCSDASSTTAQAMALEQPAAQPVQHQPDIQTLEPTTDAPQRPDWAYHKGPTLGVVLPFEGVKASGLQFSSSRTLLQINAALKEYTRLA